jgi:hypothetical protein
MGAPGTCARSHSRSLVPVISAKGMPSWVLAAKKEVDQRRIDIAAVEQLQSPGSVRRNRHACHAQIASRQFDVHRKKGAILHDEKMADSAFKS